MRYPRSIVLMKCVDVPRENCKDRQIAFLEQDLKVQSPE